MNRRDLFRSLFVGAAIGLSTSMGLKKKGAELPEPPTDNRLGLYQTWSWTIHRYEFTHDELVRQWRGPFFRDGDPYF